jgi:hypothetical protein
VPRVHNPEIDRVRGASAFPSEYLWLLRLDGAGLWHTPTITARPFTRVGVCPTYSLASDIKQARKIAMVGIGVVILVPSSISAPSVCKC